MPSASSSSCQKPGACPALPGRVRGPCLTSCQADLDCPAKRKCCSNGCGRRCQSPVWGVCLLPRWPGPCLAFVLRFFYNPASQRCERFIFGGCHGNGNNFETREACLWACSRKPEDDPLEPAKMQKVPVSIPGPRVFATGKPGACPEAPLGTTGNCGLQCRSDHDCKGSTKCCSNGCGLVCKFPVFNKPGVCPLDTRSCPQPGRPLCFSDSHCPLRQKCCYYACHLRCTVPVLGRPGRCPPEAIRCVRPEPDQCRSDDDCLDLKRCCYHRCGLKPGCLASSSTWPPRAARGSSTAAAEGTGITSPARPSAGTCVGSWTCASCPPSRGPARPKSPAISTTPSPAGALSSSTEAARATQITSWIGRAARQRVRPGAGTGAAGTGRARRRCETPKPRPTGTPSLRWTDRAPAPADEKGFGDVPSPAGGPGVSGGCPGPLKRAETPPPRKSTLPR
ncbi:WAP four-disulfide core domain protein 8 [Tachyglossus aculeatus]|uniref:WAP four-disulfide core domain protein 8 n=1 Tax=Tachyglossus aculeatus TaxID=9261 RepID=UPI0018F3BFC3|nr:WAP four-disulfide core domain protein 8 [Tachyglossus aculeatus]